MSGNTEVTYDILEWFPILYCQNVFKYLSGKDVIQASGVNKEWHKFTGETQQMKKLKLVFTRESKANVTDEDVKMFKNSKRNYQNIELRNISLKGAENLLAIFADRAGSWKTVKLENCEVSDDFLSRLIQIIEPSVEDLVITCDYWYDGVGSSESARDLNYPKLRDGDPSWTFPCLKDVESDHGQLIKYFGRCTSLVKVFVGNPDQSLMWKLVRNNHNLKEVNLRMFQLTEPLPFECKLQKLWTDFANPEVLYRFLETQAQSLEFLFIEDNIPADCLELILSMPKLTSLAVSNSYSSDRRQTLPVTVSTSITTFEAMFGYSDQDPIIFEAFIESLPNLKHFKSPTIDDVTLQALARHVPALESFETRQFNVTRLPDRNIFPNLKEFKAKAFHEEFEEPTGDDNFSELVKIAYGEDPEIITKW